MSDGEVHRNRERGRKKERTKSRVKNEKQISFKRHVMKLDVMNGKGKSETKTILG